MPPPRRVLVPAPPGYEVEWQVLLEVTVWEGMRTVYAPFSPECQREIETAWERGQASIFFVPAADQRWEINLAELTMRRVDCPRELQGSQPVRRVFAPSGTADATPEITGSPAPDA